ncbi:Hint domain-containing protein [Nonomuraea glycinis]|uniref:Hint domain-containing protein n=1 Tax=Nonomuraea glycinis TaxID=2047744 RepID=UPI002E141954|nr:Hint domain-containing protein [Nonomuraea glycinis]
MKKRIGGKTRTSIKSGPCSSFVPGTKVLMADGATKPIEDIKTGDKVIATDPTTGKTTARKVLDPITSKGVKNLVRVTVGSGDEAGVFTATGEHPFWVPTTRQWQQANMLWPGQYLRTGGGTYVQVSAITAWTSAEQRVHNLTVAGTHTYDVLAGNQAILVHNSSDPVDEINPNDVRFTQNNIGSQFRDGHSIEETRDALKGGTLSPRPDPPGEAG